MRRPAATRRRVVTRRRLTTLELPAAAPTVHHRAAGYGVRTEARAAPAASSAAAPTAPPRARQRRTDGVEAATPDASPYRSPPSFDGHRPRSVAAPGGPRTSFNCRRAHAVVTRLICGDPELAALDRELSRRYARVVAAQPRSLRELQDGEVDFLNRRGRCTTGACVADVYQQRLEELRGGY